MCPSATKFEAEIIAMTLDLLGADNVSGSVPGGLITSGGSASIAHAVLAYREQRKATISSPNIIKPETAHPAFAKAGHLFGVEMRTAPVDPITTKVDVDWVRRNIDANTVALVGSACNYGCTSTAASADSSCPSGENSATTSTRSTSPCPA
jgi:glutamate/tyrosine decarboxylase-like PLP-dependent enzyme